MRVAMIDPSLFTLPYDRELALGLAAAGHQVALYGRRPGDVDGEVGGIDLRPLFYRLAGTRSVRRLPGMLRLLVKGIDHAVSMQRLAGELARDAPDVIHFQWLPLPVVDRLFLRRLRRVAPLVLTVHDTNPFNGDPAAGLQQQGAHASFGAFDRLIVHTDQGRRRLLDLGIAPGRVVKLEHGLLHPPVEAADGDGMEGELTFVLFGKLKPYKGLDLLVEAFGRLPAGLRAACRVRVVGKPYNLDLDGIRRRIAALGIADRVSIEPRFVADAEIPGLFAPGTVAVFPYREIEASGVLSLALAHGRPVIASRLGWFTEAITDGVEGRLVGVGDVAALAAAMGSMAADRQALARMAAASLRRARAVPSWKDIAGKTALLYRTAIRQRALARGDARIAAKAA